MVPGRPRPPRRPRHRPRRRRPPPRRRRRRHRPRRRPPPPNPRRRPPRPPRCRRRHAPRRRPSRDDGDHHHDVKAIVLLGGQGTRLRPLTLTTPKQLLPVVEVPMLERVLAHLKGHGVDEAVLSLGYRPDAFFAAYPDHEAAGVRLDYAVEPEPLDT